MPFATAIRSLGRAGLFSLSVLRGVAPTADFLRELVREIYKIGARSLPIIAVGGAFVGLSLTLLGYRALETYGAANQVSALLGLGLYRELAPVLTALLFIGRAGSSIAAELGPDARHRPDHRAGADGDRPGRQGGRAALLGGGADACRC